MKVCVYKSIYRSYDPTTEAEVLVRIMNRKDGNGKLHRELPRSAPRKEPGHESIPEERHQNGRWKKEQYR